MHLVSSLAGLAAVSGIAAAQNYNDWSQEDVNSGKAWSDVSNTANDRMRDNVNSRNGQCNYDNAQVRKEWRNMAKEERKSFTDAVQCLHHIPYQRMTDAQKVELFTATRLTIEPDTPSNAAISTCSPAG